mmetsp:Transcript_11828/g.25521  ORF Transcript_11828/g.25521 Transcript_11828/m.25521 type:complete len:279 (-) Transcript_11828:272-1108(-)
MLGRRRSAPPRCSQRQSEDRRQVSTVSVRSSSSGKRVLRCLPNHLYEESNRVRLHCVKPQWQFVLVKNASCRQIFTYCSHQCPCSLDVAACFAVGPCAQCDIQARQVRLGWLGRESRLSHGKDQSDGCSHHNRRGVFARFCLAELPDTFDKLLPVEYQLSKRPRHQSKVALQYMQPSHEQQSLGVAARRKGGGVGLPQSDNTVGQRQACTTLANGVLVRALTRGHFARGRKSRSSSDYQFQGLQSQQFRRPRAELQQDRLIDSLRQQFMLQPIGDWTP